MTRMTHAEFLATLTERFGIDAANWAFVCPNCKDIATGADLKAALEEHPRTRRDGSTTSASQILGQECIGRTLGALAWAGDQWDRKREAGESRGCDWAAYGLFRGPLIVDTEHGEIPSFEIAPAAVHAR